LGLNQADRELLRQFLTEINKQAPRQLNQATKKQTTSDEQRTTKGWNAKKATKLPAFIPFFAYTPILQPVSDFLGNLGINLQEPAISSIMLVLGFAFIGAMIIGGSINTNLSKTFSLLPMIVRKQSNITKYVVSILLRRMSKPVAPREIFANFAKTNWETGNNRYSKMIAKFTQAQTIKGENVDVFVGDAINDKLKRLNVSNTAVGRESAKNKSMKPIMGRKLNLKSIAFILIIGGILGYSCGP